MSISKKVLLNGVDVSNYILNFKAPMVMDNEVGSATIICIKSILSIGLKEGDEIQLWKGSTSPTNCVFKGNVCRFIENGSTIVVTAFDKMWQLKRREVTKVFKTTDAEAGKFSSIFTTLVQTYGGLTADATDSGTVVLNTKYLCIKEKVFDKCNELRKTLNWQMYYSPTDDKVHFEPEGATTYSNTLTVGDEIINVPQWDSDAQSIINKITVIGQDQSVSNNSTYVGNGSTTEFGIPKKADSVTVYFPYVSETDKTLLVGGVLGMSTNYDYLYDKEAQTITFKLAPLGQFLVEWTYKIPTYAVAENGASQLANGIYEDSIYCNEISNNTDAQVKADAILNDRGDKFTRAALFVKELYDIYPGYKVNVVDNINGKDLILTVTSVTYQFPEPYDIIEVGRREMKGEDYIELLHQRLAKLEKKALENEDVIPYAQSFPEEVDVEVDFSITNNGTTIVKNRWVWENVADYSNGTFEGDVIYEDDKIIF